MTEPTHNKSNGSYSHTPSNNGDGSTASLFDVLLLVLRNRRLVLILIAVFGVMGLAIAITADPEYTASATLISENEPEGGMGGIGNLSLLRGIGLNLASGASGLTPETYPDVLLSREVRLAVVRDSFYFAELGKRTTFVEYAIRPSLMSTIKRNTIRVPGRIMAALSNSGAPANNTNTTTVSAFPTRQEEIAMRVLVHMVEPTIKQDTGLLTITVTTNAAKLSTELTESFLKHLSARLDYLRTQKASQNLKFIESRFEEATVSLLSAENELARFNDRNNNPQSARLRTEQSRLERQLTFKSELYRDLQTQLTQEKIEFERSRPLITVLENPAPPIDPSGPGRLIILITSLMMGGMLGVGITLTKALLNKVEQQEDAHKIEEFSATVASMWRVPRMRFLRKSKRGKADVQSKDRI
ncbi:MAG: Wzz/FepE/Etk N-terminal domain-containing protein [Rhodothermales bacterium]